MDSAIENGSTINLKTVEKEISKLRIGLGWDVSEADGQLFDLDISAFMLTDSGHIPTPDHVVFYHNPKAPDGSMQHFGDNRTGDAEGDDETLEVNLPIVNRHISEIVIAATVYNDSKATEQFHLGMMRNAYIRIYDGQSQEPLLQYSFTEGDIGKKGLAFGKLVRQGGEWFFEANSYQVENGFIDFIEKYG